MVPNRNFAVNFHLMHVSIRGGCRRTVEAGRRGTAGSNVAFQCLTGWNTRNQGWFSQLTRLKCVCGYLAEGKEDAAVGAQGRRFLERVGRPRRFELGRRSWQLHRRRTADGELAPLHGYRSRASVCCNRDSLVSKTATWHGIFDA